MRNLLLSIILLVCLSTAASATAVPEHTIRENRDGQQLLIETYTLAPEEDPSSLIREPFEEDGFHYIYLETAKNEHAYEEKKFHSETVTVETASKDMAQVLSALTSTMAYDDGTYSGVLTLEHSTIKTEAAGYARRSYTVTDTQKYENLPRNDPAYIPLTAIKNGQTLSLSSVQWAVTGTSLEGAAPTPSSYTATATYTGTASASYATGYITAAKYQGEITSSGLRNITYTVTYWGKELSVPPARLPVLPLGIGAALILFFCVALAYFLFLSTNANIYQMTENGQEYELLGKQRVSRRKLRLDLTQLKQYPRGEVAVELRRRTAVSLFGRMLTVLTADGSQFHRVEQCGGGNYWFKLFVVEEVPE